jgi:hypothetical protein
MIDEKLLGMSWMTRGCEMGVGKPYRRHAEIEFSGLLKSHSPEEYERRIIARPTRSLRDDERALVSALVAVAQIDCALASPAALDAARVKDMMDGGMGSIRFLSSTGETGRGVGHAAAELWYTDCDDVAVTFCLILDDRGDLYEVDVWKVDFSPLKRYPRPNELLTESSLRRQVTAR